MSLLQPSEAPEVRIEPLPATAHVVLAEVKPFVDKRYNGPMLWIHTWTQGGSIPTTGGEDEFDNRYCSECNYNTDEMEYRAYGETVCTDDGDLALRGTYYTESPCPRYDGGLSDVSFPCPAGWSLEDLESDEELSAEWMKYGISFKVQPYGLAIHDT